MFSLIICSKDTEKFSAVETMYSAAFGGADWELIHISDPKSLAEGYNRGVAMSRGEALIFSHDDVEILSPHLPRRLSHHLANFDLIGIAGTRQLINAAWSSAGPPEIFGQVVHPLREGVFSVEIFGAPRPVIDRIQALDGVFLAARRSLLDSIRFDAETFDHFHHYDIDFSYQAYQAGFHVAVANDINLFHQSRGRYDEKWIRSAEKFDQKWLGYYAPRYGARARCCRVTVNSCAEALRIMNPSYWND